MVRLLDCTLRDGGYVNNWHFGRDVIGNILKKLVQANIDVIECGYLSHSKGKNEGYTLFTDLQAVNSILPSKKGSQDYAVMINFGEYPIDIIPEANAEKIIIRVAFKKKDAEDAFEYCKALKNKGYRVFVQPMGIMNYADGELIELIHRFNTIKPEAFYIVDSFGVIEIKDFKRLLFVADNNLDSEIYLGYHSHNNLQQAYGNAKFMVEQNLGHKIILDASVFGMGRGAGNLNMELFAEYLNKNLEKNYVIEPLLEIIDEYLRGIYSKNFWGYSLPFYLSSVHNCHPNYASYFAEKNMLTIKSMNEILRSIPDAAKVSFNEEKAECIYQDYQKNYIDDRTVLERLRIELSGEKILILAPGKSIVEYSENIQHFISENRPVVISVNVASHMYKSDFIICCNEKRYGKLPADSGEKVILSSNIKAGRDDAYTINYTSYLCKYSIIADNATLMLFNLLIALGISHVYIAGFDGYSMNPDENYFEPGLSLGTRMETKVIKNALIKKQLGEYEGKLKIQFLTCSLYLND
ncbi:MAG: aldolase catalytic domain-containing protein [Clostridiaceae bacterium]